jgi:geranylgeranyl diphosphate synthase type II
MNNYEIKKYLDSQRRIINEYIKSNLEFYKNKIPSILEEAIDYSLFPGGKRLRPILVLEGGRLSKAQQEVVLPVALAVELIHNYSLIHDDLPALDNDDYRRNKPTLHKQFSEAIAILTGDALLSLAFHILSKERINHEVIELITEAIGPVGMIRGQVYDIIQRNSNSKDKDPQLIIDYIYSDKTAKLIEVSLIAGYILGKEIDDKIKERLSSFGKLFGIAYQLWDDIKDFSLEEKKSFNLPKFIGLKEAHKKLNSLISSAINIIKDLPDTDILTYLVKLLLKKKNENN